MSRWLPWNLVLLLALAASNTAAQDKPAENKNLPAPPAPNRNEAQRKLLQTSTLVGELLQVESEGQAFRLRVPYQYSVPNPSAFEAFTRAQLRAQQALARGDRFGYQSALNSMAEQQRRLYSVKTENRDFNIEAAETMIVRLPQPKAAFDDMGNIKTYTARELAALRGRDNLYEGEPSDLIRGQLVQVTIVLPKATPPQRNDFVPPPEPRIEATRVAIMRQPLPR